VKFYANTFGGTVFVTQTAEIIYSLPKVEKEEKAFEGWVLKEELLGGKVRAVKGAEKAATRVSYFIGNDPSLWRSNIPTYGLVNLGEVYKGIKVELRAYGRSVEKLFYVRAGANPGSIRLRLSGGESFRVDEEGGLEIKTDLGRVKFSKPVAYQEINGKRVEVAVKYDLAKPEVSAPNSPLTYGFKLGDYDKRREVIIDPLLQSTYLGGNGYDDGWIDHVDASGNIYVSGTTDSTNFPGTSGGAQPSYGGGAYDVFITKLNSSLTSIVQSTYLGGNGYDSGWISYVDSSGNVYVAGTTDSTNLPGTSGGAQPSYGGDPYDVFIVKLNPALTSIVQSTYLGGNGYDDGWIDHVDASGNIYVSGTTDSTNLPGTSGGAQPSYGGDPYDVFIAKLNSGLTSLQSTYLGGNGYDSGWISYVDSSGNVYVSGTTSSTNFPGASGGAQPSYGGGVDDVFIAKLNPALTSIVQSTYLGGNGYDDGWIDHVDPGGNIYVSGTTDSTNLPGTSGGAQPSYGGGTQDLFIAKLNSGLTSIVQSTYLGGNGYDSGWIDHVDPGGNIYVSGTTDSTNLPGTSGGAQPSYGGGTQDLFIAKLNSALTSIVQSTYLGGNGYDSGWIDHVDSGGNIYVSGATSSANFPGTSGGAQPSYGGGPYDVFIAKLNSGLTSLQSTYVGGNGDDDGWIDHVDSGGNVYVSGTTSSTNFPGTSGGAQPSYGGGTQDLFIAKLNSGLTSIVQSTYLGGNDDDWGWIGHVDSGGNIYVSGATSSTNFPGTSGGAQPSYGGGPYDVFIAKLNSGLTSLQSTYVGGNGDDWGELAHVDSGGNIYVVGTTSSTNFPGTSGGAQPSYGGGTQDLFIAKLDSSLTGRTDVEVISTPTTPSGPTSGTTGTSYSYSTGGSSSNLGHSVQYLFDWGDGTNSEWLPVGTTSASKSWVSEGTYMVQAQARCAVHTSVVSGWSGTLSVTISSTVSAIFSDVPIGYWAEDYINAIYNAGITTGCAQDDPNTPENERRYCPEDIVTREQMAAFIVRAVEGEPASNYCDSGTPFPDVIPDMWSCKYIKRLKELAITTGYENGTYGPYDLVPREQMAAFMVRAVEGEPAANYCDSGSLFPDVTSDMWSCRYIKRLKELGITTGYEDGRYGPYDFVTRAQMAAFLARAFLGMQ
jgi:hypothetical protein